MQKLIATLCQPLNLRIAALAGVVLLLLLVRGLPDRFGLRPATPASFVLVPAASLGPWRQEARWIYPAGATLDERHQEYGVWERDGLRVMLSYDHHAAGHNALNCFVGMGQVVASTGVLTLATADGSARFNIAQLRDGEANKVAVASSCSGDGCVPYPPPPQWRDLLRAAYWQAWWRQPANNERGIAVNLHAEAVSATSVVSMAELQAALTDFISRLDLAPAREWGQR